jgi:uncharacterized membrane protein YesL
MKDVFRVIHASFHEVYHHLGYTIWSSLFWLAGVLPLFTSGPVTAGLLYTIKLKKAGQVVTPQHFWHGIVRYARPSSLVSLVYLFISIPGIFYFRLLVSADQLWIQTLSFVLLYILIIWHLLFLYLFPLMVEQEIDEVTELFKRSFRLVTEHFFFSVNLALMIMLITIISGLIPLLLFTVWIGWTSVILYNALIFLLQKYDSERYQIDLNVSWKGFWKMWKE